MRYDDDETFKAPNEIDDEYAAAGMTEARRGLCLLGLCYHVDLS
jgi:hypothetical protein